MSPTFVPIICPICAKTGCNWLSECHKALLLTVTNDVSGGFAHHVDNVNWTACLEERNKSQNLTPDFDNDHRTTLCSCKTTEIEVSFAVDDWLNLNKNLVGNHDSPISCLAFDLEREKLHQKTIPVGVGMVR